MSDPVTYTAVLPVAEETVHFVSGLLAAERRRRGTRRGGRGMKVAHSADDLSTALATARRYSKAFSAAYEEDIEPQAALRQLSLEVRLPEDAGLPSVPVWADREKLGQVGSSGNSSGPHLHFQVNLSQTNAASHADPYGAPRPASGAGAASAAGEVTADALEAADADTTESTDTDAVALDAEAVDTDAAAGATPTVRLLAGSDRPAAALASGAGPNFTFDLRQSAETMAGHIARISTGANSVNYQFDEWRIGPTFAAVTLVFASSVRFGEIEPRPADTLELEIQEAHIEGRVVDHQRGAVGRGRQLSGR